MATSSEISIRSILSTLEDAPEVFDFAQLFGTDGPVELEIGSGKGLFLLRESQRRPNVQFIGVEWASKYAKLAAERLVNAAVTNVRIYNADVRLLCNRFPDHSFTAIHIYFPDPWWKQRHKKRRIVNPQFLEQLVRVLKPQGELKLATDVEEYFGVMQRVVGAHPQLELAPPMEVSDPQHDLDYLTHFERKYRKEGRPIYRVQYVRI